MKSLGPDNELGDCVYCLECDRRPTPMGSALRIQLERYDDRPMGWEELHAAFERRYPGRWAIRCFPPADRVMNGCNKYTIWVLDLDPVAFDISRDAPPGTTAP